MKKVLVFSLLLGFSIVSFAQNLKLGVCLNPHFDWFNENSSLMKSDGSKTGIMGGLVVENYFSKNYAFATGIMLGSYGGRLVYNDSVTIRTDENNTKVPPNLLVKYKLQYITVPIGLKLKTNQFGYFSYYASLGFAPQINIRAKAEAGSILDNADIGKEVGLFNISYYFGAGLEYGIGGSTAIVVGVTYNNGFMDILTKQDSKVILNYLTVNVGVMF